MRSKWNGWLKFPEHIKCYMTRITGERLTHAYLTQIGRGLMTDQSTYTNKVQLEVTYRNVGEGLFTEECMTQMMPELTL